MHASCSTAPAGEPVATQPPTIGGVVHDTSTTTGGTSPAAMAAYDTTMFTRGTAMNGTNSAGFHTTGSPNSMISEMLKHMGTAANAESRRALLRRPNSRMAASSDSSAPAPPIEANTSRNVFVTICTGSPPAASAAALAAVPGTNTLCATPSSMLPPWMPKNHMTLFRKRYRSPLPNVAVARGKSALTLSKNSCSMQLEPENAATAAFAAPKSAMTAAMGRRPDTAWLNTLSRLSPYSRRVRRRRTSRQYSTDEASPHTMAMNSERVLSTMGSKPSVPKPTDMR